MWLGWGVEGRGVGARLIIVNANLYLIHRGITWINFHIIQPVVVLVIDPHLPELNCCLISQRTGWRGLADSIWKRTWGRHERIFLRDFVKVLCQFVIQGHLLFLPYFFFSVFTLSCVSSVPALKGYVLNETENWQSHYPRLNTLFFYL